MLGEEMLKNQQKHEDRIKYLSIRAELEEKMKSVQNRRKIDFDKQAFQFLLGITSKAVYHAERERLKDDLTGLVNRLEYVNRLNRAIEFVRRRGEGIVACVYIDIDNFKDVNDIYGHGVGDKALKIIGEKLKGSVRPYDTVARLSGDEFAVLGIIDKEEGVQAFAERLTQELRFETVKAAGFDRLSASIGVASISSSDPQIRIEDLPLGATFQKENLKEADLILMKAEIAMYNAKKVTGTSCIFYQPDMRIPERVSSR